MELMNYLLAIFFIFIIFLIIYKMPETKETLNYLKEDKSDLYLIFQSIYKNLIKLHSYNTKYFDLIKSNNDKHRRIYIDEKDILILKFKDKKIYKYEPLNTDKKFYKLISEELDQEIISVNLSFLKELNNNILKDIEILEKAFVQELKGEELNISLNNIYTSEKEDLYKD